MPASQRANESECARSRTAWPLSYATALPSDCGLELASTTGSAILRSSQKTFLFNLGSGLRYQRPPRT
jgi:hypothetical protein